MSNNKSASKVIFDLFFYRDKERSIHSIAKTGYLFYAYFGGSYYISQKAFFSEIYERNINIKEALDFLASLDYKVIRYRKKILLSIEYVKLNNFILNKSTRRIKWAKWTK